MTLPNLRGSTRFVLFFNEVENVIQLCSCLPAVTTASSEKKTWLGNTLSEEINSSVHNGILDDTDIQAVTSLSASLQSRHLPTAATQWSLTSGLFFKMCLLGCSSFLLYLRCETLGIILKFKGLSESHSDYILIILHFMNYFMNYYTLLWLLQNRTMRTVV